jgi:LacI family repressor for deo operon, udp, cdd, tsx, nupC, and nupG
MVALPGMNRPKDFAPQRGRKVKSSITVKDVAKSAGVGVMTVSRVINNSGYVSQSTRERVTNAIRELGYTQNMTARSLSSRKSQVLAIIIPDMTNAFFSSIARGAERTARRHGYHVLIGDSEGTVENERAFVETAVSRMADGVILVAPRMGEAEIRRADARIPAVVVDRGMRTPGIGDVYVDNKRGSHDVVEYLISMGHRRIGFVSGPRNVQNSRRRRAGYESALREHGLAVDARLVCPGAFMCEDGIAACDHFLDLSRPPTAVFCSNDLMAIGLLRRARERGLSIPEDLSIVGFDDIPLAEWVTPALTTVRHPMLEMGTYSVELLLTRVKGAPLGPSKRLENTLVVRESARPPKGMK